MKHHVNRRDFLKAVPAASALAFAGTRASAEQTSAKAGSAQIGSATYRPVPDYPIQPKRYSEVTLKDTFWKPKVEANAKVTIPFEVEKLTEGGRTLGGNVLEAAILSLATHPNTAVQAKVDAALRATAAKPGSGNRGFEAAVTYFQTTGKRDLLDLAIKNAEALYDDFKHTNPPFNGGERDALNCSQLYRVTGDKKHLDLAKHYLDIRGLENSVGRSRHNQSYKPVVDQSEVVGHAVNCVTLVLSMHDVGVLTGLTEYTQAAQRMWTDAATKKMYITGGVGSTGHEGFGEPYVLPNISAYAETCAVLMFMTLNQRMFMASGDGKYIDVMERGMYNNALSGISVSADHFFYVNRLSSAGDGRDLRWQRASLECCPPNLVRFLAQMPGFIYAQDQKDSVYVNLYVSSDASFKVGGKEIVLAVQSEMPYGGKTTISVTAPAEATAALKLRIPGWARDEVSPGGLYSYVTRLEQPVRISVNKASVSATPDRMGYVTISRAWKTGDQIEVEFPMEVRKVSADAKVTANRGRMAVERGPIVYCAEWPDCEGGRVLNLLFDSNRQLATSTDPSLFGGVPIIRTEARLMMQPELPAKPVTLIPYHLWANRGAGEMNVWLSKAEYAPGDFGPAGGLIFYVNPNYAADGWRYLEAAPFDQSAGTTWGCFRRAIPGARGTAIGTGRQNTKDMMEACTEPGTAAYLCTHFRLNGVGGWFLPSRDELSAMYTNLRGKGLGDFQDRGIVDNFTYWASSQQTADMSVHIDFADLGRLHGDDKDFPRRVRAIRAF
jgi:uncharacterized protein